MGALGCGCGLGVHAAELPGGWAHTGWGHMVEGTPQATTPGGLMDVQMLTCLVICWQLSWNRKLVL